MTFYLKHPGTKGQQIAALKAAHPDMVAKDGAGKDILQSIYTHDIALHYDDQTPAGSFVMVEFFNDQKLPGSLPVGLTKVWEAGGAPVVWAGE